MKGYLCKVCRKKYEDGKTFYPVVCVDGFCVPTCSIECFNIERNKQIEIAKEKLKEVEKQLPIIEIW